MGVPADYHELRVLMAPELPPGLLEHIDRVVATLEPLARRHGIDVRRALLTAQAHDLLRAVGPESLLAEAEKRGLTILPEERQAPILLHGPLGALELQDRGWMDDPELLAAAKWHTTGHPDFGQLAWAVFVADKVEPEKMLHWPALQAVAELAEESVENAALLYLALNRRKATREGWTVHPLAEAARRALRQRVASDHQ